MSENEVKWHPVTVNKNSEIISGDSPEDDGFVWVTIREGDLPPFVERICYGDGMPLGEYIEHRFWGVDDGRVIVAWAHCEEPDPYDPEGEE